MTRTHARYGWVRDLPDHRDYLYAAPPAVLADLPPHVDMRPACPPVYDQGQLGSCTANALAAAVEFDLKAERLVDFAPSRLFIYYNERDMEGSVGEDSGAQIRDGAKSIADLGVCPEALVPYDIAKFAAKPSAEAYASALLTRATSYARVTQTVDQMRGALAAGRPFTFGFTVYESFESRTTADTGIVQMPKRRERMMGGHAVLAVGYDDPTRRFIVRNSWGSGWGQGGYFLMPYEYLANPHLASDLWVTRSIGSGS